MQAFLSCAPRNLWDVWMPAGLKEGRSIEASKCIVEFIVKTMTSIFNIFVFMFPVQRVITKLSKKMFCGSNAGLDFSTKGNSILKDM